MQRPSRSSRMGNYANEAKSYDLTRGASPTVVRLVTKRLGPAEGRSLLDVGGGTGNYAQVLQARGWSIVLVDAEMAMAARSGPKVGRGRQVVGDAAALPFSDGAFDGALMLHAMHLVGDQAAAFRE